MRWFSRRKRASVQEDPAAWAALIDELDRLGFWKHVDPVVRKEQIGWAKDNCSIHGVQTERFCSTDDENLAEGGIVDWLAEYETTFARRGVDASVVETIDCSEHGYTLRFKGPPEQTIEVYSQAQLDAHGTGKTNIWELAARSTQQLLNRLLADAGSPDRAYWISGGNDAFVWLITPQMADAIRKSGLVETRELPRVI